LEHLLRFVELIFLQLIKVIVK
jgi:hypothetical protein